MEWLRENARRKDAACFTWPFEKSFYSDGRARISFDGVEMAASRAMCIIVHGEPPSPYHDAAHFCGNGNKGCLNPSHVRWATKKENQHDRWGHGTMLAGEKASSCKLSRDQVIEIRKMAGTMTYTQLAEKFGISRTAAFNAAKGHRWAWLKDDAA